MLETLHAHADLTGWAQAFSTLLAGILAVFAGAFAYNGARKQANAILETQKRELEERRKIVSIELYARLIISFDTVVSSLLQLHQEDAFIWGISTNQYNDIFGKVGSLGEKAARDVVYAVRKLELSTVSILAIQYERNPELIAFNMEIARATDGVPNAFVVRPVSLGFKCSVFAMGINTLTFIVTAIEELSRNFDSDYTEIKNRKDELKALETIFEHLKSSFQQPGDHMVTE